MIGFLKRVANARERSLQHKQLSQGIPLPQPKEDEESRANVLNEIKLDSKDAIELVKHLKSLENHQANAVAAHDAGNYLGAQEQMVLAFAHSNAIICYTCGVMLYVTNQEELGREVLISLIANQKQSWQG